MALFVLFLYWRIFILHVTFVISFILDSLDLLTLDMEVRKFLPRPPAEVSCEPTSRSVLIMGTSHYQPPPLQLVVMQPSWQDLCLRPPFQHTWTLFAFSIWNMTFQQEQFSLSYILAWIWRSKETHDLPKSLKRNPWPPQCFCPWKNHWNLAPSPCQLLGCLI